MLVRRVEPVWRRLNQQLVAGLQHRLELSSVLDKPGNLLGTQLVQQERGQGRLVKWNETLHFSVV